MPAPKTVSIIINALVLVHRIIPQVMHHNLYQFFLLCPFQDREKFNGLCNNSGTAAMISIRMSLVFKEANVQKCSN